MTTSSLLRKPVLRLLALGFVVLALLAVGAPPRTAQASEGGSCSQCWTACNADEQACFDWCNGCPYYDGASYTFQSGPTVNCAGGVEECMNNCHYGGLFCTVNCC
jgi:hypothetical protein